MNMKEHILTALREEFNRWEELLTSMNEEQLIAPRLPSQWSIKDVIAHLGAWQQRSIARCEAAMTDRDPEFPRWFGELNPDSEGSTNQTNAWIYQSNRDLPWSRVHQNWKEGFLRFLELAEAISEEDMLEKEYSWLNGYPLYMILVSSYAHHHIEHFEPLRAWLKEHDEKAHP